MYNKSGRLIAAVKIMYRDNTGAWKRGYICLECNEGLENPDGTFLTRHYKKYHPDIYYFFNKEEQKMAAEEINGFGDK
jgi:hypothetical protein